MDMHLYALFVLNRDDRVAVKLKILDIGAYPEVAVVFRRVHKLKDKLHAVAVLKGAVLVEQVKVELLLRNGSRSFVVLDYLAEKAFQHTLGNCDKSQSAAVNNARFLKHGQHFGGLGKGFLHLGNIHREKLLNGSVAVYLASYMLNSLAGYGQNSALGGLYHRAVSRAVASDKSVAQFAYAKLGASRELHIKALEKLRQNNARVSARAEQHTLA